MISPVFVLAKIEKKMSRLSYHLRSQNTLFKGGGGGNEHQQLHPKKYIKDTEEM